MRVLRQIAIHEAGHAVVDYALGFSCNEVSIIYNKKGDSYGHVASPNCIYGYEFTTLRDRKKRMREKAIGTCAGLAAEHVFYGVLLDTNNDGSQMDFQRIFELEREGLVTHRGGFIGDEGTWRFISRVLSEAKQLVLLHHDTIEQLADILVEKKKMSGKEVEEFLSKRIER